MKRIIYLLIFCGLCSAASLAQNTDSILQNNYWQYRDNFNKHFTRIGYDEGLSLPMANIMHVDCGDMHGNKIGAGDVMAAMSEYLGVLATEYHLLKQKGQDLTAVKNEIYYALHAIDRVDLFGERMEDLDLAGESNGYLTRGDVPKNYYQHWEQTDNMIIHGAARSSGFIPDSVALVTQDVLYPANWWNPGDPIWLSASDKPYSFKRTDNPALQGPPWNGYLAYKHGGPGADCPEIFDETTANELQKQTAEMSQDHVLGILVGLRFIQKYVDNDAIKPTDDDDVMYPVSTSQVLAERLMDYMTKVHKDKTFVIDILEEHTKIGEVEIKTDEANYIITNAVKGTPVTRG